MTFSRTAMTAIGATALLTLDAAGALLVASSPANLLTFLAYALVGTYLILRRPRNAVGWLLIAACWMLVVTSTELSATDTNRLARSKRFDRARIDGDRIATAFAERMRDEVDLGSLIGTLTTTVEGAIRPVGRIVWLRSTERVDPRGAS